jgi:hypothetical protein
MKLFFLFQSLKNNKDDIVSRHNIDGMYDNSISKQAVEA